MSFLRAPPLNSTPGKAPKRKAQSHDERTSKLRVYEKCKRPDREFRERWREGRPWLDYDDLTGQMKCTLCIAHNSTQTRDDTKKKYTFLTGCSNLRTTSISDHEKSAMHINSVAQEKAKSKPATTIAAKTIIQLNEHRRQQLEFKFRNMHAVAKHNQN